MEHVVIPGDYTSFVHLLVIPKCRGGTACKMGGTTIHKKGKEGYGYKKEQFCPLFTGRVSLVSLTVYTFGASAIIHVLCAS